ncbi:MAG: TonB-dependent receptor plug domain-containing protein [Chitinivibrionales bacterium]|nr:TonB-dependent receptor plug domain-containing protein [Chitinivibrionales bacterium]MBD3358695.1 TonB-dependent receptor plug domain-containing protein [Chitinivibrionales bacterium]
MLATLALTSQGAREDASLSLADLMNLELSTGTLLEIKRSSLPVSLATITREMIEEAHCRTLLDVLEVYIPGLVTNLLAAEGKGLGVRAVTNDRNYKYIMLVNGVNVSQKAHAGPITELGHMDVTDIHQVQFIRGPGSVTYGAGAVGGIINIITQSAKNYQGFGAHVQSSLPYRALGAGARYGGEFGKTRIFGYASVLGSKGAEGNLAGDNIVYIPNGQFLMDGLENENRLGSVDANPYYKSYQGRPQVKAHLSARFAEIVDLRVRYTQHGYHGVDQQEPTWIQGVDDSGNVVFSGNNENVVPFTGLFVRQFSSALEGSHTFDVMEGIKPKLRLSFSSQEFERAKFGTFGNDKFGRPIAELESTNPSLNDRRMDPEDPMHLTQYFGENEFVANAQVDIKFIEMLNLALGGAVTVNSFRKPWGKDWDDFMMGDLGIIFWDPSSNNLDTLPAGYYDPSNNWRRKQYNAKLYAGEGWSTVSYAGLFEGLFKPSPYA